MADPITSFDDATDALVKATGVASANKATRAVELTKFSDQAQTAYSDKIEAAKQGALSPVLPDGTRMTTARIMATGTAEIKAQQEILDARRALTLDPEIQGSFGVGLMKQQVVSAQEALKASKVVKDNLAVGFTDSPIQYVVNQFTLPKEMKRADAAQLDLEKTRGAFLGLNQSFDMATKTINAAKQSVTQESLLSIATAHQAGINTQVADVQLASIANGTKFLTELNSFDSQQLQDMAAGVGALGNQKTMHLREGEYRMAQERARQELVTFNWTEGGREGERNVANTVVLGLTQMGFKIAKEDMIPGKVLTQLKINPVYAAALTNGMVYNASGVSTYGNTPTEAAITIIKLKAPMTPEQAPLKALWNQAATKATSKEAAGQMSSQQLDPHKEGDILKYTAYQATKMAEDQLANIKPGDPHNIYGAPGLDSILTIKGVAEDPFVKSVIIPQAVNGGMTDLNVNTLISRGEAAVKAGIITDAQLDNGIATIFSAAVVRNQAVKQYIGAGLPNQVDPKTSKGIYNTEIEGAGRVFGGRITNVADIKEIARARAIKRAHEIFGDAPFGSLPPGM